jgi:hypothetical protein
MKERKPFFEGKKHTDESKQKNRDAHIGKPGTWIGRTHSEESKIKMSNAAIGRKLSEETRNKMSKARKGIKFSDIHREKLSNSAKGDGNNYKRYLEKTGLPHAKSKPVNQFTLDGIFIKEWVNARKASIELNLSYSAINANLNGKSKKSQGFIWKYKD